MIKSSLFILSLLLSVSCANAQEKSSVQGNGQEQNGSSDSVAGETHRIRYPLKNASQKLVSDSGKGPATLYGTRNFRSVINGIYYRGGANNLYFKPKRDNRNPLPEKGLENLCQEGFSQAVYFYSTNFSKASKQIKCKTFDGNENTLHYAQISPLAYRESDIRTLHGMIFERVRNPRLGPVYGHCWNGWHASGYVAATALRQFCDFTAEEAIAYWNLNTDGNHGSYYDTLRSRIRDFTPDRNMTLTEAEKAALCPSPDSLEFR